MLVPPPSNEKKQTAPPATPSQPWNIQVLPAPEVAKSVSMASVVAKAAAPARSSAPHRSTSPVAAASAVAGAAAVVGAVVDGLVDAVLVGCAACVVEVGPAVELAEDAPAVVFLASLPHAATSGRSSNNNGASRRMDEPYRWTSGVEAQQVVELLAPHHRAGRAVAAEHDLGSRDLVVVRAHRVPVGAGDGGGEQVTHLEVLGHRGLAHEEVARLAVLPDDPDLARSF